MKLAVIILYCVVIVGIIGANHFINRVSGSVNISSEDQLSVSSAKSYPKTFTTGSEFKPNEIKSSGTLEKRIFSSENNIIHKFNSSLKRIKSNTYNSDPTGRNSPDPLTDFYYLKKSGHQHVNLSFLKFLIISKMLC